VRQDFVYQQSGAVCHAACTTTGAEPPFLAAECDQFLIVAGFTADSQESVFKSPTLQVLIKFLRNVCRQVLAMAGKFSLKPRPVLLNDLVE
jgi:hypothetical protein